MKNLIILFLLLLASCSTIDQSKNKVKLYVFECGNINVSDVSVFSPGYDKGVKKRLTNSCYLIQHPTKGNLLWDTGLPDELAKQKDGIVSGGVFHLKVENTLESQLEQLKVKPSDINFVGISHFHFDHTGNLNKFPHSKILLQKEEKKAALSKNAKKYHFNPDSYNKISKKNFIAINKEYDVFGDGSALILAAVGHTPGHQVLQVNLEKEGTVILSGDLYHFTKNREFKRVPSFNFDKSQTLKAMDKIENRVKETQAQFWIQHDYEQNQTIKHSPKFYF